MSQWLFLKKFVKWSDVYQISPGNQLSVPQNVHDMPLLSSKNISELKTYFVLITGICVNLIFLVSHVTKKAVNMIE